MADKREVLIAYDMTTEEEYKILASFTEAQRQLLQTALSNIIMEKAAIVMDVHSPYAHIQQQAKLEGKREVLELLLSANNAEAQS